MSVSSSAAFSTYSICPSSPKALPFASVSTILPSSMKRRSLPLNRSRYSRLEIAKRTRIGFIWMSVTSVPDDVVT